MKLCDRCRVAGCLLNYGGKACKNARKQNCPYVVFTNADRAREMNDEELAKFMLSNDGAAYCKNNDRDSTCYLKGRDGMTACELCALDWLREEAEETARRLKLLETMMERLRKDGTTMQYDVTLKVLPERQVASVRGVIPAYDQEQRLWNTLMQETAGMRLVPGDPCYTLAVFHDGEFKEGEVDVEVQKSVRGGYRDTEHVKFKAEPPVEIASATYTGGYDRINEANQAVANWVRDNGYDFAGLSFCIYHVSPYDTENPEEYVTEVCYPVRKK